ncbi:hypothetical protein CXR04_19135 [Streptomyces sp. CMB-StM0423]|nr:hypothetical protein CXR04_19135 [Streptomyces sp. CMB-StM0423]
MGPPAAGARPRPRRNRPRPQRRSHVTARARQCPEPALPGEARPNARRTTCLRPAIPRRGPCPYRRSGETGP